MSLTAWITIYGLETLFFCWVFFLGGDEQLEGTFTSGCLLSPLAVGWSAEGIRVFVASAWCISSVWFLLGLFVPEARLLWW